MALPGGERLVQPVRAWDNYFCIGLYGPVDDARVKAAKEHGINTYMSPMNDILEKYGMNTAPGGSGKERQHQSGSAGLLYRQNWDEPDAYETMCGHLRENVSCYLDYDPGDRNTEFSVANMVAL